MPDDHWAEYLEAVNKCHEAVKLTAYHTMEAARHADATAIQTRIVVWNIKEYLRGHYDKQA